MKNCSKFSFFGSVPLHFVRAKKETYKIKEMKKSYLLIVILLIVFGCGVWEKEKSLKRVEVDLKDTGTPAYEHYLEDSLLCWSIYDTLSSREVFVEVDQPPTFGDSEMAMEHYFREHVKYPLMEGAIQSRVIVQLVVETDGSLTQLTVVRGVYPEIDQMVLDVLKEMPAWTPAMCHGKKVPVRIWVPVNVSC